MSDEENDVIHVIYSFCIVFFFVCIVNFFCSKVHKIMYNQDDDIHIDDTNTNINIPPKYEEIDNPPPY